jgi:hypothetical protein
MSMLAPSLLLVAPQALLMYRVMSADVSTYVVQADLKSTQLEGHV